MLLVKIGGRDGKGTCHKAGVVTQKSWLFVTCCDLFLPCLAPSPPERLDLNAGRADAAAGDPAAPPRAAAAGAAAAPLGPSQGGLFGGRGGGAVQGFLSLQPGRGGGGGLGSQNGGPWLGGVNFVVKHFGAFQNHSI